MAVATFVAADGVHSQVTGTLDNLAAGAETDVFCDLGPQWNQFSEVMVYVRVDPGDMNYPTVWFSDTPGVNKFRLGVEKSSGIGATCCIKTPGDGDGAENAQGMFAVAGRYIRVHVKNEGAVPFGVNSQVSFAAYQ